MSDNRRPLGRHRLSWTDFTALGQGDGDGAGAKLFVRTELSWRKLALSALIRAQAAVPDPTGPLDSFRAALDLLDRAERREPEVVIGLLLHPPAGIWLSHTLRRLRSTAKGDEPPLFVDVGYLHALAAVAAIRVGIDFTIRIPVREGKAVLPSLGYAEVAAGSDYAEVCGSAGVVTVSAGASRVSVPAAGETSDGWQSATKVSAVAGDVRLAIVLDDIDPYRDMRQPKPPQRLDDQTVARWRQMLGDAWRLVVETQPERASGIAAVLATLTPLPAAERLSPLSASCDEAFGTVVASEPDDALQLAVTLVHEYQHLKLGALLHLLRLHDGDRKRLMYAAWRDDPRPVGGVLQGCYAFLGIASFWLARRDLAKSGVDRWLADFEFALWRQQFDRVLEQVAREPSLTDLGRRFVEQMTRRAHSWRDEALDVSAQARADAAAADHYGQWRAYHVRPSPERISALMGSWMSGERAPAAGDLRQSESVHFDPSVRNLDARAVLVRLRMLDPSLFGVLVKEPSEVMHYVGGAVAPDVSYVDGNLAAAREGYLRLLKADAGDAHAWLGLGLTLADTGDPAANGILRAPEVVRAVAAAVARSGQPADPVRLAGWLRHG